MTNDTETIGNNTKLEDIAKMPIDIKLLDDPVSILRIIFGNECFNAGRIKDGHICFGRSNGLTDGFGNISKVIKYDL